MVCNYRDKNHPCKLCTSSLQTCVEFLEKSYAAIGDKGDIGFIDFEECKSLCSYNPSEESQIVNISIPFPLSNGKPQSGFVGETKFDSVTIKNTTSEPLDLWSVKIYDSKPEDSSTLSILKPPTAGDDVEHVQAFMEAASLEDRVLRTDQTLTIWLSCKPKEIGLHTAAVDFNVGDETIERLVILLAEDKISNSLSASKPYQRSMRKKQNLVDLHGENASYVVGRSPSRASSNRGYKHRLPQYPIPADIRAMVNRREIPGTVSEGLKVENYGSFFKNLIAMEEIRMEGYIHRVEAEQIHLKFENNFHSRHRDSNLYNVQFTYNRMGARRLYQAVEAAEQLDKNFLFPSASSDGRQAQPRKLARISRALNEKQLSAAEVILACKGGPPYIIHGPPGTGKTMTLIEAILQIYRAKPYARVLVCAPSNSAADHILDRLISQESVRTKKRDILRLNAYTRPFEDVNPKHLVFCYHEDFFFTCPSLQELAKYRIIISTYTSSSRLYAEGLKRGHFSYFFLDEAGQASEPETMVPLSHLYARNSVVVLAGDPMQLGPVVFSKDAERYGLGTSYLERLFECELYCNEDERFMVKLVNNYRTHEAILRLPSELFYGGELIPCKEGSIFSSSWDDVFPNKEFPLVFIGIQGCDEREGSNPSWFNRTEASKTVEMIQILMEEKGLREDDIGVITPYQQQVKKISGALEVLGLPNIKVGSVEQFQGQEREVNIVSTVRSTVKHNQFDRNHYLGFLSNPRRFNVAATRARSLLIVIGNPHIVCKDPNWNELLWYCEDNGSYKGCFLPARELFNSAENYQHPSSTAKWEEEGGDAWRQQPSEYQSGGNWDEEGDNDAWRSSQNEWVVEKERNHEATASSVHRGGEGENNFQPSDLPWE